MGNVIKSCRRITASLLLLSTAACYTRSPLGSPTPPPETRVIAQLTDSGTVAMGQALGPGALEIEGVVASANPSAWDLHLLRVDHRDGKTTPWNRELVSFPRSMLTNPTQKRLDKKKSWIMAGAVTASAILAARIFNFIGADEASDGTPVPQQSVVPIGGRH